MKRWFECWHCKGKGRVQQDIQYAVKWQTTRQQTNEHFLIFESIKGAKKYTNEHILKKKIKWLSIYEMVDGILPLMGEAEPIFYFGGDKK